MRKLDMEQKENNNHELRNKRLVETIDTPLSTLPSHDYIHAATSDNTRKAYQSDIRHFLQWGGFLPTSAEAIMQYLQQYAKTLNPRTLVRRLTALKQWHLYQGFTDPTANPAIRKTLSGIKNVHGKPKERAPALTLEALTTMVHYLKSSNRLIDARNSALIQIGFFGAFRRSELANITWENVQFVPEGIEIIIPRSKTDQAGEGQICAIPHSDIDNNSELCPVAALTAWKKQSNCQSGYVFRKISKNNIDQSAIHSSQVNIIIKSVAKACKLPNADRYSSHSLRRGFATAASKEGAPFGAIMRQGRWRHEGTVLGYIEEGKRFDQNAATMLLNKQKIKNEKKPTITNSHRS
jgi:integrase